MPEQTFDRLFKNATVVNQDGEGVRDIGVTDGKIAGLGTYDPSQADDTVDCTGLHILPGVIDSQVHFREPGMEHKETLVTGSLAAVMGGVTCVFEMPNTNPTTTDEARLADKVARAHHKMHSDFAFWVGGTRENAADTGELERLPGAAGIKVFMGSSTGNLLVEDDEGVRSILKSIKRRAAFHSEDEPRLRERAHLRVKDDPSSHPVWRDAEAALKCTRRLVSIAEETGARIHVLHISTADEMPFLAHHKRHASVEVTPHHLTLSADDYEELGTYLQMNPPVRDKAHREGIWWGVHQGVADVIGSDHAPHTHEEKAKSYPESPAGMPGVQTLVPVMLNHVAEGRLSLARFVDMTSHGPQRLFGLAGKGRIALGYDADLTVVDLKRTQTITDNWIASICGWTPYRGQSVKGWPVGTVVRGEQVMWEGDLTRPATGETAKFVETLPPLS
ncbi:MAG: dihydroorotase [Pseudomonadota bacterium]